jgi:hypothetical protein
VAAVTASKKAGKTRGRPFEPGHPGGPGRPSGSRNAATLALDAIGEAAAPEILQKLVDSAKGGDVRSAEIVLSRIWPARKGRPVSMQIPKIKTAADVVAALGLVAEAVGAGEITPDEGAAVAAVLETKRKAIETIELEARITELEKKEHNK